MCDGTNADTLAAAKFEKQFMAGCIPDTKTCRFYSCGSGADFSLRRIFRSADVK